jgi:uncharacterized protein YggT (Ycf19 family)
MQDNQQNNENLNAQVQVQQDTIQQREGIEKVAQLVWYAFGLINVVLALRIFFLLFNAQSSGFTGFLYNITAPFVMPFAGIFPAPGQGATYFDTAALVAIIIYSLVGWGIVTLIRIVSNNQKAV